MEKYFSREFQDKLKEERAKKASSTSGDIDLELSEEELKEAKGPLVFPNWMCGKDLQNQKLLKKIR